MTGTGTPAAVAAPDAGRSRRLTWVLVGAGILVVALVIGLAVTAVGSAGTGELALDVSISQHRDSFLTAVARLINVGFGPRIAPLLLLVGCAVLWMRRRFAAVLIGGLTVLGWLSVELGKVLVHRPRPPLPVVHALVSETAADSYPSGHTAFAAAVMFAVAAALVLAGRSPRRAFLIGMPVVTVVGLSRLYLGVHYLADVVASVVFAGATILVVTALTQPRLIRLRDSRVERTAS